MKFQMNLVVIRIHKELKLVKSISLNNMVLYNKDHVLTRYNSPIEIINLILYC